MVLAEKRSSLNLSFKRICLCLVCLVGLVACAPEPGSDAWCADMENTPRSDWSMSDAAAYAKSCIVKADE